MKAKLLSMLLLALLPIACLAAEPKEKDITPILTSATWRWDHPTGRNLPLKFQADGTCEAKTWKAAWRMTGPTDMEIVFSASKKMILKFAKDGKTFIGIHADGLPISGRISGDVPASVR